MAVVERNCCVVVMFVFVCCFVSVVVALQLNDDFDDPSSDPLSIHSLDGSKFENFHGVVYHVHKRSANVSSKKAFEVPKKTVFKGVAATIDKALAKHFMANKSATDNSTTPTPSIAVNQDNTTSGTNLPEDKSNASVSTTPPITSTSTSLSPAPVNGTSVGTPVSTTESSSTSTTTATSIVSSNDTSPVTTASTEEVLPPKPVGLNQTEDYHVYYNSSFMEGEKAMTYWVDFKKLPEDKVVVHRMLSDSHRRAATVTLSFDFPFYGSPVRNITIATGGFLYMGDYVHSWLAATQYVAPLMANFDTRLSNESTVMYFDNGTAFVIEWSDVVLQESNPDEKFTFQAILLKNGDIAFVYEYIPISITKIGDELHPVKVGLSDAYVIDRVIYFIRRKTIYEYHRIDLKNDYISNHTAIYFSALTTCPIFQDCESCMAANISLDCVWCDAAKRCSDGLDRKRQDWLQQRCDIERSKVDCSLKSSSNLGPYVQPLTDTPSKTYPTFSTISSNDIMQHPPAPPQEPVNFKPGQATNFDDEISQSAQVDVRQGNFSIGGVVAVLLLVALALGTLVWVGYAYRNPHTSSGQLLIKYRPSQWRFRSGEARYTAASVHM